MALLRIVTLFVTLILLVGCTNFDIKDYQKGADLNSRKRETDLRTESKEKFFSNENEKTAEISFEVEKEIKNIATKFIIAEYEDNVSLMLKMTKGDARKAVGKKELTIIKPLKLQKINSLKVVKTQTPEVYQVITAISSIHPKTGIQPIYYEVLWFKKYDKNWLIIKVERDA